MKQHSVIIVIPARYASSRFPAKVLADLQGMPVLEHVYRRALESRLADRVVIATDHHEILERARSFGAEVIMTSENHPSGTDRIAEVAKSLDYDIIVNVQGDEPLIRGEMIDAVIELLTQDPEAHMGTLVKKIEDPKEYLDPNVVKVTFDRRGYALYFSRAPIPFVRDRIVDYKLPDGFSPRYCYKHIGLYSYKRDILLRLSSLPQVEIEKSEKLEQLRALYYGYRIKVRETTYETIGVDTPEDLERVKKWLSTSS
ncbi:MAG: 3-deoxy-manno-octulosonate cytidylyltransferase [Nitrospirae bacterium]|nr:3-deoxy-manno-octulosonate cytidylyltransferase [Nitrospirota bacterium]